MEDLAKAEGVDETKKLHPAHRLARGLRWSVKAWKLNNLSRTVHYLQTLKRQVAVTSPVDAGKVEHLLGLIQTRIFRIRVLAASRTFFSVLLYASVASAFAVSVIKDPWVEALTKPILGVSLLVGTPISFFYVVLFSKLITLYHDDVRLLAAHILAILSKYDRSDSLETFFKEVF